VIFAEEDPSKPACSIRTAHADRFVCHRYRTARVCSLAGTFRRNGTQRR
jgi:hypothetical protein